MATTPTSLDDLVKSWKPKENAAAPAATPASTAPASLDDLVKGWKPGAPAAARTTAPPPALAQPLRGQKGLQAAPSVPTSTPEIQAVETDPLTNKPRTATPAMIRTGDIHKVKPQYVQPDALPTVPAKGVVQVPAEPDGWAGVAQGLSEFKKNFSTNPVEFVTGKSITDHYREAMTWVGENAPPVMMTPSGPVNSKDYFRVATAVGAVVPGLADFLYSPMGVVTVLTGGAGPLVERVVSLGFSADMGAALGEQLADAYRHPTIENIIGAAETAAMAFMAGAHGVEGKNVDEGGTPMPERARTITPSRMDRLEERKLAPKELRDAVAVRLKEARAAIREDKESTAEAERLDAQRAEKPAGPKSLDDLVEQWKPGEEAASGQENVTPDVTVPPEAKAVETTDVSSELISSGKDERVTPDVTPPISTATPEKGGTPSVSPDSAQPAQGEVIQPSQEGAAPKEGEAPAPAAGTAPSRRPSAPQTGDDAPAGQQQRTPLETWTDQYEGIYRRMAQEHPGWGVGPLQRASLKEAGPKPTSGQPETLTEPESGKPILSDKAVRVGDVYTTKDGHTYTVEKVDKDEPKAVHYRFTNSKTGESVDSMMVGPLFDRTTREMDKAAKEQPEAETKTTPPPGTEAQKAEQPEVGAPKPTFKRNQEWQTPQGNYRVLGMAADGKVEYEFIPPSGRNRLKSTETPEDFAHLMEKHTEVTERSKPSKASKSKKAAPKVDTDTPPVAPEEKRRMGGPDAWWNKPDARKSADWYDYYLDKWNKGELKEFKQFPTWESFTARLNKYYENPDASPIIAKDFFDSLGMQVGTGVGLDLDLPKGERVLAPGDKAEGKSSKPNVKSELRTADPPLPVDIERERQLVDAEGDIRIAREDYDREVAESDERKESRGSRFDDEAEYAAVGKAAKRVNDSIDNAERLRSEIARDNALYAEQPDAKTGYVPVPDEVRKFADDSILDARRELQSAMDTFSDHAKTEDKDGRIYKNALEDLTSWISGAKETVRDFGFGDPVGPKILNEAIKEAEEMLANPPKLGPDDPGYADILGDMEDIADRGRDLPERNMALLTSEDQARVREKRQAAIDAQAEPPNPVETKTEEPPTPADEKTEKPIPTAIETRFRRSADYLKNFFNERSGVHRKWADQFAKSHPGEDADKLYEDAMARDSAFTVDDGVKRNLAELDKFREAAAKEGFTPEETEAKLREWGLPEKWEKGKDAEAPKQEVKAKESKSVMSELETIARRRPLEPTMEDVDEMEEDGLTSKQKAGSQSEGGWRSYPDLRAGHEKSRILEVFDPHNWKWLPAGEYETGGYSPYGRSPHLWERADKSLLEKYPDIQQGPLDNEILREVTKRFDTVAPDIKIDIPKAVKSQFDRMRTRFSDKPLRNFSQAEIKDAVAQIDTWRKRYERSPEWDEFFTGPISSMYYDVKGSGRSGSYIERERAEYNEAQRLADRMPEKATMADVEASAGKEGINGIVTQETSLVAYKDGWRVTKYNPKGQQPKFTLESFDPKRWRWEDSYDARNTKKGEAMEAFKQNVADTPLTEAQLKEDVASVQEGLKSRRIKPRTQEDIAKSGKRTLLPEHKPDNNKAFTYEVSGEDVRFYFNFPDGTQTISRWYGNEANRFIDETWEGPKLNEQEAKAATLGEWRREQLDAIRKKNSYNITEKTQAEYNNKAAEIDERARQILRPAGRPRVIAKGVEGGKPVEYAVIPDWDNSRDSLSYKVGHTTGDGRWVPSGFGSENTYDKAIEQWLGKRKDVAGIEALDPQAKEIVDDIEKSNKLSAPDKTPEAEQMENKGKGIKLAAKPEEGKYAKSPKDIKVSIPNKIAKKITAVLKKLKQKGQTIPILDNVAIATKDGRTKLFATDLENAITYDLGNIGAEEGATTLPISSLDQALKGRSKDDLSITTKDGKASISVGGAETSTSVLGMGSYPELPEPADKVGTVSVKTLAEAIRATIVAISAEESRFTLNGALLRFENGKGVMVSTDGHRLVMKTFDAPGVTGAHSLIISRKAMSLSGDLFGKEEGSVDISRDDAHIALGSANQGVQLLSRKLTGNFPDYMRVLPDEAKMGNRAVVNREQLLELSKRALSLKTRSGTMALSFRDGQVAGYANGESEGESVSGKASATLEKLLDGASDNPRFSLNAGYLRDFLQSTDAEKVEIKFKDSTSALVLRPDGDMSQTVVIMPMRDGSANGPQFDDGFGPAKAAEDKTAEPPAVAEVQTAEPPTAATPEPKPSQYEQGQKVQVEFSREKGTPSDWRPGTVLDIERDTQGNPVYQVQFENPGRPGDMMTQRIKPEQLRPEASVEPSGAESTSIPEETPAESAPRLSAIELANKAKSDKYLSQTVQTRDQGVVSRGEQIKRRFEAGGKLEIEQVPDEALRKKIQAEYDQMKNSSDWVPTGNANHPRTIKYNALKAQLDGEITKPEYRLTDPQDQERYQILTKTGYDYARGLEEVKKSSEAKTATPPGGDSVTLGSGLGALQPAAEAAAAKARELAEESEFVQTVLKPRLEKFAAGSRDIYELIRNAVNPRGPVDPKTLNVIYKLKGGRDELNWLLNKQFEHWHKQFEGMARPEQVSFIDRVRRGEKQPTPDLQAAADLMRSVDEDLWKELHKDGILQAWLDNHFRVLWKDPPSFGRNAKAERGFLGLTKRQFMGTKGFAKQHFFDDMTEGLTWTFSRNGEQTVPLAKRSEELGKRLADPNTVGKTRQKIQEEKTELDRRLLEASKVDTKQRVLDALKWVKPQDYKLIEGPHGLTEVIPYSDNAINALKNVKGPASMPDITEKRGGTPTYWNPQTMFQAHYADSMKYLTMRRTWDDLGNMGLRKFVKKGESAPAGFVRVDDGMVKTYFKVPTSRILSDARKKVAAGSSSTNAEAIADLAEDISSKGQDVRIGDIMAQAGEWWVEENAGRLMNRMVSTDYIRSNTAGRFLLGIKNGFTAIELGISPFHFVFEGNETIGSMIGVGARELFLGAGKAVVEQRYGLARRLALQGVKDIATAPLSAIPGLRGIPGIGKTLDEAGVSRFSMESTGAEAKRLYSGAGPSFIKEKSLKEQVGALNARIQRMRKSNPKRQELLDQRNLIEADRQAAEGEHGNAVAAFGQTQSGKRFLDRFPHAEEVVHDYFMGGGKLHMDESYRIRASRSFIEAFQEARKNKEPLTAGLNALPAMNEMLLKPLFDVYIPNLKLAAFMREYSLLKVENEGKISRGEVTSEELARRTVDFVEDRYGEMNFDNLFWHNTMKTGIQLLTRSITWKLGNIRASGKAVTGIYKTFKDFVPAIRRGEAPAIDPAAAWMLGMLTWTTALSVSMSTLLGGKKPSDIFTSILMGDLKQIAYPVIDKDGSRASIPTYFRDWLHAKQSPWGYVKSSMAGDIGRFADIIDNKDFYNTEIRHPGDPAWKQALDLAGHMVPMPFSLQSGFKASSEGRSVQAQALGSLGFTKAPAYIEQSPAEQVAHELALSHIDRAARTSQEAQHSQLKSQLATQYHRGNDVTLKIEQAIQEGKLTQRDLTDIQRMSQQSPLARAMARINKPDELMDVWEKASPEEQQEIGDDVGKRLESAWRNKPYLFDSRVMARLKKLGFIQDQTVAAPQTDPPPGTEGY